MDGRTNPGGEKKTFMGQSYFAAEYGNMKNTSASAEKLMNSANKLGEVIKSIRETTKIVEPRGVILKNYRRDK